MPGRSEMTGVRKMRGYFMRYQAVAALAVILCLAAFALGANPFAAETVAPFDLLLSYSGWSSVGTDRTALNTQPSDIVDGLLPVWVMLKKQIREGKGALWYPYGAGGVPVSMELGNPAFWLFVLIRDNALAFYLVGLAKLLISGFGCYLLLRIFLRWLPSIWGSMVYMLCGFNTAWFYWDHVATAMWIPWLLWTTVNYLATENVKWLPAIAVASLLLILGGFPAVAAFGFYSFALVIFVWSICERFGSIGKGAHAHGVPPRTSARKALLPFAAAGLAFLMAAFTLVPFIENMGQINLSYRANVGSSFEGFRDLLLFLAWETPLKVERTAYLGWPVVLFALIGMVLVFRSTDDHLRKIAAAMLVLVVLGIAVLFGFVPETLVRLLPVFNSNHWSRMIVIPLLGLAVLSSIGLELLSARVRDHGVRFGFKPDHARQAVMVLVLLIIGTQFILQKRFFNAYNAVVPSAWFYPVTPTIGYVTERLKPLQSVIADNSYMVSGTLGAYGIPEWYAHAFRTDREKEVLGSLVQEPFASPTAAFINGRNIRFDSPWMDRLAVRHLLVNRRSLSDPRVYSLKGDAPVVAPPLPDSAWRQYFTVPEDTDVGAIGFLFETYGNAHAPANVRLILYDGEGRVYSESPELFREAISPGHWSFFEFSSVVRLKRGKHSLELSLPDYAGRDKLSAWAVVPDAGDGNHLAVDGERTSLSLALKIGAYQPWDPDAVGRKWRSMSLENDILIFENTNVVEGAYYLSDLEDPSLEPDYTAVHVEQPSADTIVIDSVRKSPGWIVLPMHLHHGWKAFVNGRQVASDAYQRLLPAVPVQGACRIVYRYDPASFTIGLGISGIGVALFLAGTALCIKFEKKRTLACFGAKGGEGEAHHTDPML